MSDQKRGAAAAFVDDDATIVELSVSDRVRREVIASVDRAARDGDGAPVHEAQANVAPWAWDDRPTRIGPPPLLDGERPVTSVRLSARGLLEAEGAGPGRDAGAPARGAAHEMDDVTRIAAPVALLPETRAAEPADRAPRASRSSPVRIASAAVLTILALVLGAGWGRAHRRAGSPPAALGARSPAPPLSSAPAPVRPSPVAPAPIASTPIAPAVTAQAIATADRAAPALTAADEHAAVEAVRSGALEDAARIYGALAAANPSNEAYREAARILLESSEGTSGAATRAR
jgi:hypothetical protein